MKTKDIVLGVVLVALVSGFMWQAYQRGHWKSRVENLEAEAVVTDSLLGKYTVDSVQQSAWRDSVTTADSMLQHQALEEGVALEVATGVRETAETDLKPLREAVVGDPLTPEVRELLAGERSVTQKALNETSACQALLTTSVALGASCGVVVDSLDTRILTLEGLRARLTAERDTAMVLLKPPSLINLTFELGVGLGCVLTPTGRTLCGFSGQVTLLRVRFRFF